MISIPSAFSPTRRLFALACLWPCLLLTAPASPAIVPAAPVTVNAQPRYFFTVDLDPRYQIVGTGPLSADAAETANCYCFTYDSQGHLQRIEYRRAGVPMPDPFFQVPRIDFEYAPGIERRWYRDAQGKPMQSVDGVEGSELALNTSDYAISVTNLKASGSTARDNSGVIRYLRTLDNQGRLVAGRRTGLLGTEITDNDGYFETRTVYDTQGHRIEYGNYDAKGAPLNDKEGVALIRTIFTPLPGGSTQLIESYFDATGLAVSPDGNGIHEQQRTLDSRGLLLSESYYDAAGAPMLDTDRAIHERRLQYDDRGNQLSESYFDTEGRLKNIKPQGFAQITYKYDAKNRITERAFFGDDGTPQVLLNLGAAIIRQEYDDQGNMIRRQFFDGQGNPSAHLQYGAPAIRIKVEGDTTTVSLRDANDRPMENPINGYASFSYKPATEQPLTASNHFYRKSGRPISRLRVFIIQPHLHALATNTLMQASARCGAAASALGALLAMIITLRKGRCVKHRWIYVPSHTERFLGWFAVFLIGEGMIRFFLTIYWAMINYEDGKMGRGIYIFEVAYILFFIYRLMRLPVTMRLLNIRREDALRLVREFFTKAHLEPQYIEPRGLFITPALTVRLRYFRQKFHAYISFKRSGSAGESLVRALNQHLRTQARTMEGPPSNRWLRLYYPAVACCYGLLSFTGFYTLYQLLFS